MSNLFADVHDEVGEQMMLEGCSRRSQLLETRMLDDRLPDDRLLSQFVATHSSAAFETLVRRHAGLVYGSAIRQVRDPHLADEITQSVFVLLSRKAKTMSGNCVLAGWLIKTTRFVALDALKLRERRRQHEMRAAAMHADQVTDHDAVAAVDNAELFGALDDGLLALKASDRRVILMRYYESKTYDDVGRHMGIDAEAARKRVGRAVERLRTYFVRRKSKISATATSTAAVAALLKLALQAEAPPHVVASAISFANEGGRNVLADLASEHLLRVNVLRWSLAFGGFACLIAVSGNSLRSTLTVATSVFTHASSSPDSPGD